MGDRVEQQREGAIRFVDQGEIERRVQQGILPVTAGMGTARHQQQIWIDGFHQVGQRPGVAPLHGVVALDADDVRLCIFDDLAHLHIGEAIADQMALIDVHQSVFLGPAGEWRVDDLHLVAGALGHRGDAQQANGRAGAFHYFERVDADVGKCAAQRYRLNQPRVRRHEQQHTWRFAICAAANAAAAGLQ